LNRWSRPLLAGLVAAAALLPCAAPCREWTKIRIGVEGSYPPFNTLDKDGHVSGFDVDIANALCAQLKAQCTFVVQDWDGMIPALMAKKFDTVISSMSITEARKQKVAFTGKYYNGPARFVVRKGAAWDFSPAGMKGRRIGVPSATIFDAYVTDVYEKQGVKVIRYAKQEDTFLDLAAGRVDTVLADVVTIRESFFKTAAGANFEIQGPALMDVKYFGEGAGIATRKTDLDLRDQLDAAIKAIRANGTYDRIMKKYFSYDIWGG
jgi:arginine/ornithine transport system substrate-binding protein